MEPGLFGIFQRMTGQPDIDQQIAQAMGRGPGQPGGPPASPLNPPPPSPAGAAPAAGGAAAAPAAPPTPQAYQTQPDINQLYMQFMRQQQASQMFNQGLAGLTASLSRSPDRNRYLSMGQVAPIDAGETFGNLMKLHQYQQGQQNQQQMLGSSAEIAQKTGLPESVVRGMILSGQVGELTGAMAPPTAIRDYQWAHKIAQENNPNGTPEEIDAAAQNILLGSTGGGDSATRSWRQAKLRWDTNPDTKGTPYPWGTGADDNATRFSAWSGGQVEQEKTLTADQGEAAKLGPQYRDNLQGARDRVAGIVGLKGYDQNGQAILDPARQAQLQNLLGTDSAQAYINSDPTKGVMNQNVAAWFGNLSASDQQLLTQIRDATDEKTLIGGLKLRAPKRGQADASNIGFGLGGMRNVTQPIKDWMPGALSTIKSIDTATVNSFGAQGTPEAAEQYARNHGIPVSEAVGLMDDSYLPGGALYPKGRATALTTMTPEQIAAATAEINAAASRFKATGEKDDDPEKVRQNWIKLALSRNLDPKPLKDMRL